MKPEKAVLNAKKMERIKVSFADTKAALARVSDAIARRAFEIYKDRGDAPGEEKEDWRIAESEVLAPLDCGILELANGLLVEADLANLRSHEIEVSIEPRRLVIIGRAPAVANERRISTFRVINLPVAVDPLTATLRQRGPVLQVELQEPGMAKEPKRFVKAA